jgi:hypothetical protein
MIATLGDFDVSRMPGCGEYAGGEIVIQVRSGVPFGDVETFAQSVNAIELVGADDGVDFRDVGANIVAIALDQATSNHEATGFASFLIFGHLKDGVDGFLLCGIDEAAGVDYDDVGVGGFGRKLVTVLDELAHHDLSVDEVFRAAETYKTDLQFWGNSERATVSPRIAGFNKRTQAS